MPVIAAGDRYYAGAAELAALYLGDQSLWQRPAPPAPGTVSATWSFAGGSTTATSSTGATGAAVTAGAAAAAVTPISPGYASDPVLSVSTGGGTPSEARASDAFVQLTLTAPGPWSPQQMSFKVARAGTSTVRGWTATTSLDGHASALASGQVDAARPTLQTDTINLAPLGVVPATFSVRLYTYTSGATGAKTVDVDDITITGTR